MKLASILPEVQGKFESRVEDIKIHAQGLKKIGRYKDFNTRLAFDCLYGIIGSEVLCKWYKQYNVNDTHINTLAQRALRNMGII